MVADSVPEPSDIDMKKKCLGCRKTKRIQDYYRNPNMRDGHLNKCKECIKSDCREYRRLNDSVRERDKERNITPKRRAYRKIRDRAWKIKNPEKLRAKIAVDNAIRSGRLEKTPCQKCGETRVHGHHDDYSKPLKVRWLCAKCHARFHMSQKDKIGN